MIPTRPCLVSARGAAAYALLALLVSFVAAPALAQRGLRPADAGPTLPTPSDQAPSLLGRDPATTASPEATGAAETLAIRPRAIEIRGITAFDADAVAAWTAPWRGRPLDGLDLASLVDRVRAAYHRRRLRNDRGRPPRPGPRG